MGTFFALKGHCKKKHSDECPICNKKFKNLLSHIEEWSHFCDKHKVAYGLLKGGSGCRVTEHYFNCKDFAYHYCKSQVPDKCIQLKS
ncbi:MAG: hypothetical protein ACOC5L_04415 [Halobacteriota archaeon]